MNCGFVRSGLSVFVAVLVALPSVAVAKGTKSFSDAMTDDEVAKLNKSLGVFEKKFEELKPSMDKIKASSEIPKHAHLVTLASESLKHYANIGVFLQNMSTDLKKKDPKVNSYEHQLKGEIDTLELKLKALQTQAKKEHVDSVASSVGAAILIGAALTTAYLTWDTYYVHELGDVDLEIIPVFDVYTEVVIPDDVYVVHEVDVIEVHHDIEIHEEPAHESE